MKKLLLLPAAGLVTLALTGCGQQQAQQGPEMNKTPEITNEKAQTESTPGSNAATKVQQQEGGSLINTAEALRDALGAGKKLECAYKFKDSQEAMTELKGVFDGQKYRSSVTINGEEFISLMDGETIYSWSAKAKQGTKMGIKCMEEATKDLPQQDNAKATYESSQEMVDNMMDISCKPAGAVDLSVPKEITFTDTCEQMKNAMKMMNNMKGQMPDNIPAMPE